ncbi:hypothetical protein VTN00DRAFT_3275 [Thermoascus crustaceus]|uniref:uncharacterized protein n=1 Tax=Thermoascus crustaceus TaxID=5088 RepID=UPI003743AE40
MPELFHISSRWISLLPKHTDAILAGELARRDGDFTNLLSPSTASEFLNRKLCQIDLNRDILRKFTDAIRNLFEAGKVAAEEHEKTIDAVQKQTWEFDREYLILTRQRKFVEEDLHELFQLQDYGVRDFVTTYRSLLAPKLDSRIYHQRKNCDDDIAFQRRVTKYYNAYRGKGDDEDEVWCHLGGFWQSGRWLRTVHIVPKQFRSEQLSYIFGVRDADLDDVRNDALNTGEIVFVPVPQESGKRLEWKCVVLNRRAVNVEGESSHNTWKIIDGRTLKFLNDNRPAARYFYFRFIMTYFYHKERGTYPDWVTAVESTDNPLWPASVSGPYLHGSILETLAMKASRKPCFYLFRRMSFYEIEGCPNKCCEAEEELADALRLDVYSDIEREKQVEEIMYDAQLSDDDSYFALDCKRLPDEEDNNAPEKDANGNSDDETVTGQLQKELDFDLMIG